MGVLRLPGLPVHLSTGPSASSRELGQVASTAVLLSSRQRPDLVCQCRSFYCENNRGSGSVFQLPHCGLPSRKLARGDDRRRLLRKLDVDARLSAGPGQGRLPARQALRNTHGAGRQTLWRGEAWQRAGKESVIKQQEPVKLFQLGSGWPGVKPENILAYALSAALVLALAHILLQLVLVILTVTLAALKYAFVAAVLIGLVIVLL